MNTWSRFGYTRAMYQEPRIDKDLPLDDKDKARQEQLEIHKAYKLIAKKAMK